MYFFRFIHEQFVQHSQAITLFIYTWNEYDKTNVISFLLLVLLLLLLLVHPSLYLKNKSFLFWDIYAMAVVWFELATNFY